MNNINHKSYYLFSNFLTQALIVLLPILGMEYFNDKNFVAKIGFFETIGGLLFGVFSIIIIDYIKNKKYLVAFTIILMFSLFIFYFLASNDKFHFISLMILFIFITRLITNIQNAIMFKEYSLNEENGIEKYNSYTSSVMIIINIITPPVSVYLYSILGFKFLIFLSCILLILSFFFSNKKYDVKIKKNIFINFGYNLKIFFSNKYIYTPLLIVASVIFSGIMVTTIYYIYISKELGLGNTIYTYLLTVQSIGSLTAASFMYKKFFNNRIKILPTLIFTFGLTYLLFLLSNDLLILLYILAFILGMVMTLTVMVANEQYQKNCPPDIFGAINGIRITLNNVLGMCGAGLGSYVYIQYGVYTVYILNVVILIIISICTYYFYTKYLGGEKVE